MDQIPYVSMTLENWTAFRWQIALEVLSVFGPDNADACKAAVSVLHGIEGMTTIEWRPAATPAAVAKA